MTLLQARTALEEAEGRLREALDKYIEHPDRKSRRHLDSKATTYHSAFLELKEAEEAEYLTT